jgi:hypothetical protein
MPLTSPRELSISLSLPAARLRPRVFRVALEEHGPFLLLLLGYYVLGGLALWAIGRPWRFVLMYPFFAQLWLGTSGLWLAWQYLRHPRHFWAALESTRLTGALLVFVIAVPTQTLFQSLKQAIGPVLGFTWDATFARVDAAIHGGDAWLRAAWVLEHPYALIVIDLLYVLWFVLMMGFLAWVSWSSRRALRQRALVSFLLLWVIAGTVCAGVFASAGPCYADHVGLAGHYDALLTQLHAANTRSAMAQSRLWDALAAGQPLPFGGVSAFPSLHVGIAVLLAIIAWHRSKPLGLVLAAYAVIIQVGSVLLGWHYAIDGYAGALLAAGCWRLSGSRLCQRG